MKGRIDVPPSAPHPYAARAYAEALAGPEGIVVAAGWETPLLRRPITDGLSDVAGVYPLTVLRGDDDLAVGVEALRGVGLVSLVLTPDPLTAPSRPALVAAFEICRPFKTHFLIDRGKAPFAPTKHHRDRIRRSLRRCHVEHGRLIDHMHDWRRLYAELVARRGIGGMADFAPGYFGVLAGMPDLQAFVARADDEVIGMTLWFAAEGVVYNHLTAVDAAGYAAGASYALYDAAITYFPDGVINLGGGAGVGSGDGGLADFKRGFANAEVETLICGAVLDRDAYAALTAGRRATDFFPAYRAPLA